jgi:outer membrane lipoprotein-sorting protein
VQFAENETPLREGDAVLHCVVRGQQKAAPTADQSAAALEANSTDAIFFEVVPQTGELARIIVRQAGGIEVEFRFENWRFDPPIPDSMFRFQPPPGVAIVNGESADGKIPGN